MMNTSQVSFKLKNSQQKNSQEEATPVKQQIAGYINKKRRYEEFKLMSQTGT